MKISEKVRVSGMKNYLGLKYRKMGGLMLGRVRICLTQNYWWRDPIIRTRWRVVNALTRCSSQTRVQHQAFATWVSPTSLPYITTPLVGFTHSKGACSLIFSNFSFYYFYKFCLYYNLCNHFYLFYFTFFFN